MSLTLSQTEWDGIAKTGKVWVLSDGSRDVKTWYFAPLVWVRVSCLVHGWGWPRVR